VGEYVEVAEVAELADGAMGAVRSAGRDLLLARVGEAYYATQLRCPHIGADLARGSLQGTVVTCPRHGSQFDLRDGHVVRWTDRGGVALAVAKRIRSPRPLSVYPVKIEGERVLVDPGLDGPSDRTPSPA